MISQLPFTFWIRFSFLVLDIQEDIKKLSSVSKCLYKITNDIKQNKNFRYRKRLLTIPCEFRNNSSSELKKILQSLSDKWKNDTRKTTVLLNCETSEQVRLLSEAIPNQFLISIRFSGKERKEYNKILALSLENMSTRLRILDLKDNDLVTSTVVELGKCLEMATSLEELLLENNCVYSTGVPFLVSPISKMKNLRILNLAGNKIGSKGCNGLAFALLNINELIMLDLSRNDIGASGFLNLAPVVGQMTTLKTLKLGCNWFGVESSIPVAAMIEDLICLRELNLEFNYITRVDDCGMIFLAPAIQKLTNLTSLNLSGNRLGISDFFTTPPYMLLNMTQLLSIDLSVNSLVDEKVSLLAPLSKNTGLTRLYLGHNYIKETTSICLSLKNNKSLTDLSLNNNKIDDIGLKDLLSCLVEIPTLQKLDISRNDYTSIGDIFLLTNLVYLNIRYNNNNIWRKRSSDMICFSKMHRLTFLDITGNALKDSGLKSLMSSLNTLPNLKILKLGSNRISNKGVIALTDYIKTMPSLLELDLSWNEILWNEIEKNIFTILKSHGCNNLKISSNNMQDELIYY